MWINQLQKGRHRSSRLFETGMVVRATLPILQAFKTLLFIFQEINHLDDVVGIRITGWNLSFTPRYVNCVPSLAMTCHRIARASLEAANNSLDSRDTESLGCQETPHSLHATTRKERACGPRKDIGIRLVG